jgi:putative inorganic carbon (HCO3(-)) transporter
VMIYGIYLTKSRGGLLGLIVICLLALRERVGGMRAAILTVLTALALVALDFGGGRRFSSHEEAAASRLDFWGEGLQMIRHHPIWGVGYRAFADFNFGHTAHNLFVQCFAETGLMGFLPWMGIIVATFMDLGAVTKTSPKTPEQAEVQRWVRTLRLSMYGYLATGWFLSRAYPELLFLLIALSIAATDIARREGTVLPSRGTSGFALRTFAVAAAIMVAVKVFVTVGL